MIIYSTDEYGNVIKKHAQQDINGRYVYNDRKWSAEPPPLTDSTEVAVCLSGKWEKKKINAGKWYHKQTAQEKEITEYDPLFNPEDYTKLVPCEHPKWDTDKWIVDTEKKELIEEQIKQSDLYEIDRQSIRAIRAILAAEKDSKTADPADIAKLKELEQQAKDKRKM